MAQQAIMVNRAEHEKPSASDVAKADDIELKKLWRMQQEARRGT